MASSFAIANLFFVAFGGIYSATSVIIGRTLGEGNLEEARRQKNWLLSGAVIFGVARFTNIGPVQMYLCVKLLDVDKITIFHFWLKKERWLNNLTGLKISVNPT